MVRSDQEVERLVRENEKLVQFAVNRSTIVARLWRHRGSHTRAPFISACAHGLSIAVLPPQRSYLPPSFPPSLRYMIRILGEGH